MLLRATQVHGLEGVKIVSVACGWRHSMAADDAGVVYTFGWCKYGQLGHGDSRWAGLPLLPIWLAYLYNPKEANLI